MLSCLLLAALLAAEPAAKGAGPLVLKTGARLEVSSYELQGRLVRIVGSEGDLLVLKEDLVDWERTRRAEEQAARARERETDAEAEGEPPAATAGQAKKGRPAEAKEPANVPRPRLLFFTAGWCGYCRKMRGTTLADAAVKKELERYHITYVDIDAEPALADKYGVRGVPTYVALDGSKVLKRASGYQPPAQFVTWLKR